MSEKANTKKGFTLVEALIGASIILVGFLGLVNAYLIFSKSELSNVNTVQSALLAEETLEAVRLMRDASYANISGLTAGSSYFLNWNGSSWATSTNNILVDGFYERKFAVSAVYRDASDRIASSGTLDQNIKKVTATVSWRSGTGTTSTSVATYLTNLFGN